MNIPELLHNILFGCLVIGGVCAAVLSMLESDDERHYPDVDNRPEDEIAYLRANYDNLDWRSQARLAELERGGK